VTAAEPWHPVEACYLPALARWQIRVPETKPKGFARLRVRSAKAAHSLIYRRLGITATGRLEIHNRGGRLVSIPIDAANGAWIDFESRRRHGGYASAATRFFDSIAVRAETVYDIGANWGYFTTLLAANPNFAGHVYAFEIAPRNFSDLARIVTAAELRPWATPFPFGISDIDAKVAIVDEANGHLSRIRGPQDGGRGREADVRRLDTLNLPPPQFIKIDTEGHDARVLAGARSLIANARPVILFESQWATAVDMRSAFDLLADWGYRTFALDERPADPVPHLSPLAFADRLSIAASIDVVATHPEAPLDRFVRTLVAG
jgi:FkbM family methyltransferase